MVDFCEYFMPMGQGFFLSVFTFTLVEGFITGLTTSEGFG